jgi:cysteine desulfurase
MANAITMYLDHAATTTLRPEAVTALEEAMERANGNASGTHAVARQAKNALEEARERAAALLGAHSPHDVVFTSGGTEADNLAVVGAALASGRNGIVVSAIEHKAVLEPARALSRFGFDISEVLPDGSGVVSAENVASALTETAAVVSVMAANNEIGTLEPVREIAELARSAAPGVVVHTDAVQAFVGSDVTVASTGADLISLSAHKFGGPKGIGLLYVAPGTRLDPILRGGGHEAGRRPGTSNVAGAVAMVAAMDSAVADRSRFTAVVGGERDAFERCLAEIVPGVVVNGASAPRMPHFSHVRFPGRSAETLLILMDHAGIYAAAGSACQSGAVEPSHVLTAMGMSDTEAAECVRFTFGWDTAPGDGRAAGRAVAAILEKAP